MSPIDRAARAAALYDGLSEAEWELLPDVNPSENGEVDKRHYIETARAVLKAVREPSAEMEAEGGRQVHFPRGGEKASLAAGDAWMVMIDTALGRPVPISPDYPR